MQDGSQYGEKSKPKTRVLAYSTCSGEFKFAQSLLQISILNTNKVGLLLVLLEKLGVQVNFEEPQSAPRGT